MINAATMHQRKDMISQKRELQNTAKSEVTSAKKVRPQETTTRT